MRIFTGPELTADHVLASACLPTIFQAVEIDGEPYWDGGYTGNPALFPLFYETATDDILLVQINPIERRETPRTAHEIQNRLTEITFNGNLLRELRAVEFVTRLIDEGKLSKDEYKRVFMHRVRAAPPSTPSRRPRASTRTGRSSRSSRISVGRVPRPGSKKNYNAVGVRSTLDLRAAYS